MSPSEHSGVSFSLSRAAACTALIGALVLAAPVLASNDGAGSGPESDASPERPEGPGANHKRGCRSPGKNLSPAKAGPISAGGQIDIEGSGRVTLSGSFMTWGTVRGMRIRVTDQRGDGMLRVGASCVPLRSSGGGTRTATVRSPKGRFVVDGTRVRLEISGRGSLAIAVTGSGTGLLNGVGTFTVNNGDPRSWPLKAIDLALAPAK